MVTSTNDANADAAIEAALAQFRLFGAQRRVVHHLENLVERGVVGELLELDAGGSGRGVSIVGDEIAPAQFRRVHADLRRGEVNEAFGHRSRDRMADRAVLAHDVLVLKHHAGEGAIVRAGVRTADQIDHLVGLDAAGAGINRIRPDAGEVVDLEGGNGAILLHADLACDAVVAGVDVGDEAFEPVGDEFDRTPQEFRQRHRRHLVGISVHLDAERAADIFGDNAHLMLFEIEMLGEQVLHHVRRLRALMDGEALLARIPVGDDGARFVGHAGMAAEHERGFSDRVGFGKRLVRVAGDECTLERQVVAELGMDHRRRLVERGFRVGDGGQHFILDGDKRASVLGKRAGLRDHRGDRLALPAGTVDGDGVLRRRFDAFEMGEHADPRRDDFRKLDAGDHRHHARRLFRRRGVDVLNARMGVRRAQKSDMRHARQDDVADILAAPLRQAREIRPRHRAADIGVRPIERRQARRLVVGDFHFTALACATDSIASTIAW